MDKLCFVNLFAISVLRTTNFYGNLVIGFWMLYQSPIKSVVSLRGYFLPDKDDDAVGLPPGKEEDAVRREIGRKNTRLLIGDWYKIVECGMGWMYGQNRF